jgi:signal transduction histidine kinase
MQLQCFRIVQECLVNIEKHSGADEASVLVSNGTGASGEISAPSFLHICVSDNGRGFSALGTSAEASLHSAPPDSDTRFRLRANGHFGLWNMYERAEALRGTLAVDSETGGGVRITLELPLEAQK